MTVYGDLDVSVIDELPPGRTPVQTRIIHAKQRYKAYELLRQEFNQGHQAYIIYPLVEESEKSDLRDVTSMTEHLGKEVFPDIPLAMLHGRMAAEEKQKIMAAFASKQLQLLGSGASGAIWPVPASPVTRPGGPQYPCLLLPPDIRRGWS
jgi:ATP-dependent DNA helicase RecG